MKAVWLAIMYFGGVLFVSLLNIGFNMEDKNLRQAIISWGLAGIGSILSLIAALKASQIGKKEDAEKERRNKLSRTKDSDFEVIQEQSRRIGK